MHYFAGTLCSLVGLSLLAGLRPAAWLLIPEVWLWRRMFGITLTPTYRLTAGGLYLVAGAVALSADLWLPLVF